MYYFLSVFAGAVIAVMIAVNGVLTSHYSVYLATVIIHIVGLALITFILIRHKENPAPWKNKKLPLFLYSGGLVGVATTVFNNVAFGKISMSAILAIVLLGQSVTSIIIDHFGWLDMPYQPFNKKKLIGLSFIILGIVLIMVV
ncbi:DMT family transporter [Aminipila luticellarii]|uniref:DMT family transporter n=1 Tax=Aminipila luticellarii TaxID=2507160 RepID=A0A410PY25_9FIRM|nr:DMT family transporter [Aminipila luticellarii]QAT43795.1 DMT family transporter [Aminipila luticellarii]